MNYFSKTLPFEIFLSSSAKDNSVLCEQLLRSLPGKRLVYKGLWEKRSVVVKLFFDQKSAHRHWRREKTGSEAMMSSQVPCPDLLYSGQLDDGIPVLVFDLLPDAKTALKVWNDLSTVDLRIDFLHRLVEIVALLHDSSLVQEDLHLENFLIAGQQFYAIDGDAISIRDKGKPLGLNPSSRNLALLFAQLLPKYDSLMEKAALHYAGKRNLSGSQLLDRLKLELPMARRRRRHKYIEKCYRSCSEFLRSNERGQVSISRRDAQGDTLNRFIADPDAFMQDGEMIKDGNSTTVVRVRTDDCDWVIKRYNIKGLWHALKRCLRQTRAWVSWGNGHRLRISGISTPRPVAVLEKRIGPLRSTGYYVCDFVAGVDAEEFFGDVATDDVSKEQVAKNFVSLFELLHKIKIVHGDCKATNFMLVKSEPWVLDLDAMHECSSPAQFQKLFQVDRERFLRNWEAQSDLQQWFDEHLPR